MPLQLAVLTGDSSHPRCLLWFWHFKFPFSSFLLPSSTQVIIQAWGHDVWSISFGPTMLFWHRTEDVPITVHIHWFFEEVRHKIFWMHPCLVYCTNIMVASQAYHVPFSAMNKWQHQGLPLQCGCHSLPATAQDLTSRGHNLLNISSSFPASLHNGV